jgi:hydrogenase maturation protease
MTAADRCIVLGLGNTLNRDEGLGVHALHLLEEEIGAPDGAELLDGGVLGLNLLMLVEECRWLLVLDAINAGKAPGTLIELTKDQIPLFAGVHLSEHQITFQEVLGLASIRGHLPENLHLIGIQPDDISIGVDLSPTVAGALPGVVSRARAVLKDWGKMGLLGETNESTQ